ncbi:hypothetical protein [Nocardia sp. NPDC004722]
MIRRIAMLAAGSAAAAAMVAVLAGPAEAAPSVTIKGKNDNTITAKGSGLEPGAACTLTDYSLSRKADGTVGADGTLVVVLTNVRRGAHSVAFSCDLADGSTVTLVNHWTAPVTG